LQYTRSEHPSLDLIFTGNMSYFPNVEAAEILVHQVMPILWRDHHRLKLHLVGINPSPAVRALASERVIVTGFVEDIAEYLAEAKLFVAPLFSGAGLQNKLLEAMAVGVPVVTTPHANRSLEAPVPAAIRLGHDAAGIARQTAELLASPQEAEELVNHAYEHVKTHFDWKAFNETLEHVLHQARASLRETTPREPSA
jgi:glycosyltransferase involved in cell wall biosynthesis